MALDGHPWMLVTSTSMDPGGTSTSSIQWIIYGYPVHPWMSWRNIHEYRLDVVVAYESSCGLRE
jgi:hypothetical protein